MTATTQRCWDCSEVPRCPSAGFEMTCSTGGWMPEPHDMTPEPSAFPEFVICSEGKHDVEYGKVCARCELECAHGCDKPGDPNCKGRP